MPQTKPNWDELISDAVETPNPHLSNFKITRLHYMLSCALIDVIGPSAGANFHSWAVWGSRKAGVTIRQEDKDQASRDATIVAGIVGVLVGCVVAYILAVATEWSHATTLFAFWTLMGLACGGCSGFWLAAYTRSAASRLILEGNRIVLDDIGRVSARYLDYVEKTKRGEATLEEFLSPFRPGATDDGGQDLLRQAFEQYETARCSTDDRIRQQCNYFANCLAVLHEHYRLQPFISKSLPFLISKCVTQRLMTYSVGEKQLAVHEDVPPIHHDGFPELLVTIDNAALKDFLDGPQGWDVGQGKLENTRANDWTILRERMGYIVNLFRTRHIASDVVASPYDPSQLDSIATGQLPEHPW